MVSPLTTHTTNDVARRLVDLDPTRLAAEYHERGLGDVSDVSLVAGAAGALTTPRKGPADSFVLHSPLELAARAALLAHVAADARELARLRIVSLVAGYQSYEAAEPLDAATAESDLDSFTALVRAVDAGDVDGADVTSAAIAGGHTIDDAVRHLAPAVIARTSAAAHAPIFLHHLDRRDSLGGLSLDLLRPLARELARQPDWRVSWTDRWEPRATTDARRLAATLERTPLLGTPESNFIHPLLMQVDRPGVADSLLGTVLGARTDEAHREVLRVAARSMLYDTPEEAPYGWSHCLTIPQAILGITRATPSADLGLALAATHVAAFRAGLGKIELTTAPTTETSEIDPTALISTAATSHDAHVVKYVLACLDAASDDPAHRSLFLSAAQRLLDAWSVNGGDPSDPLT